VEIEIIHAGLAGVGQQSGENFVYRNRLVIA